MGRRAAALTAALFAASCARAVTPQFDHEVSVDRPDVFDATVDDDARDTATVDSADTFDAADSPPPFDVPDVPSFDAVDSATCPTGIGAGLARCYGLHADGGRYSTWVCCGSACFAATTCGGDAGVPRCGVEPRACDFAAGEFCCYEATILRYHCLRVDGGTCGNFP